MNRRLLITKEKLVWTMENWPLLWYFVLATLVFWPITFAGYYLQYDALDVYLPWRFFGSESIQSGMVPLWNPYQDSGYPFYADHQYSIWNPELLVISIFTRFNASTIVWLYVFYMALGGCGMRYFIQKITPNKSVAFMLGVVFTLGGIMVGHAQSIITILAAVWLPWALGSYIQVLRSNFNRRDVLLSALLLFMALAAGYQAISIMLFYVLVGLFLVYFWRYLSNKDWSNLKKFLLGHSLLALILLVLMAGVALSYIQVFPHLDRMMGVKLDYTSKFAMHPQSLWSFFFPFTAVQQEYPNSIISAQNLYFGSIFLVALPIGILQLRKKWSAEMGVLTFFAVLFGFAAFGNLTPIQPFLAKYVPGMNFFLYPVFYRYFALLWIFILVALGLEHILQFAKRKYVLIGLGAMGIIYLLATIFNWQSLALNGEWQDEPTRMVTGLDYQQSMFIESVVHVGLLLLGLACLFWWNPRRLQLFILVFLAVELGVVQQLNMPITVHGFTTQKEINDFLDTKAIGFPKPALTTPLVENETEVYPIALWLNPGNFTNKINTFGRTSFELKNRKKGYSLPDTLKWQLKNKGLAFMKSGLETIELKKFKPNYFSFQTYPSQSDTLVLQQTYFPGWEAKIDGKKASIVQLYDYMIALPLPPGQHNVEFIYKNPWIVWGYYFTMLAVALLFFSVIVLQTKGHWRTVYCIVIGTGICFGVARITQFQNRKEEQPCIKLFSPSIDYDLPMDLATRTSFFNRVYGNSRVEFNYTREERDLVLEGLTVGLWGSVRVNKDKYVCENPVGVSWTTLTDEYWNVPDNRLLFNRKGAVAVMAGVHVADTSGVALVMDQRTNNQSVGFHIMHSNQAVVIDSTAYYCVPIPISGRELHAFLWNQKRDSVRVTNFKLVALPER